MHIYISTDLEGVSGIDKYEYMLNQKEKAKYSFLLTEETNAAIEGALKAEAKKIFVLDSHGYSDTINQEKLNSKAVLIRKIDYKKELPKLDSSFDAVILLGYHVMSENTGGIIAHTYTRRIKYVKINNTPVGEVAIDAAIAGELGLPVIFISGDQEVIKEAKQYIPNIISVQTKHSYSRLKAEHFDHKKVLKQIKKGIYQSIKNKNKIKPFTIKGPIKLKIMYKNPLFAFRQYLRKGYFFKKNISINIKGELIFKGNTVTEAWESFIN